MEDVKQQKEDIDVLNVKVSETGASVVVMKGRIDQQDEEIGSVKTGLVTVNERVDVVEEDLGETKIKVEEVDKKVRHAIKSSFVMTVDTLAIKIW